MKEGGKCRRQQVNLLSQRRTVFEKEIKGVMN